MKLTTEGQGQELENYQNNYIIAIVLINGRLQGTKKGNVHEMQESLPKESPSG